MMGMLWKANYEVEVLHMDNMIIDLWVTWGSSIFFLYGVYEDPIRASRHIVWKRMMCMRLSRSDLWCVLGDFNGLPSNRKMIGGPPKTKTSRTSIIWYMSAGLKKLKIPKNQCHGLANAILIGTIQIGSFLWFRCLVPSCLNTEYMQCGRLRLILIYDELLDGQIHFWQTLDCCVWDWEDVGKGLCVSISLGQTYTMTRIRNYRGELGHNKRSSYSNSNNKFIRRHGVLYRVHEVVRQRQPQIFHNLHYRQRFQPRQAKNDFNEAEVDYYNHVIIHH